MSVATITGADATSKLAVGSTSKAAPLTLFDPQGREIILAPTVGSFLAGFFWRDTGVAADGMTLSLFNPVTATSIARIRFIRYAVTFDGSVLAQGRNLYWKRTGFVAPSGGLAITPTKKRSADSASACDFRIMTSGGSTALTQGSMTQVSEKFIRQNISIATTGAVFEYELTREAAMRRLTGAFDLKPGEGVGFFNGDTAQAGQAVSGYLEWDETAQ